MSQGIDSSSLRQNCQDAAEPSSCLLKRLGSEESAAESGQRCTQCGASTEDLDAALQALGRHLGASSADDPGQEPEWQSALAAAQAMGQSLAHQSTIDDAADTSVTGEQPGPPVEELTAALPGYFVSEQIGHGGMGAVYRATQLNLNREVALKVLLTGSRRRRGDIAARFRREAQITAGLDHPSIVPTFNTGFDHAGRCWYTMQLVRGSELKHVIQLAIDQKDGWNVDRAVAVLLKICQAMAFAHSRGAVHRDLKPANVMVGEHGEVYVMDWGLARMTDGSAGLVSPPGSTFSAGSAVDDLLRTLDGTIIGTPVYMPPEQALGNIEQVDHLSDIYSLGAILYHLLAGRPPYTAPDQEWSAQQYLQAVIESPPARVTRALPELVAICEKAMHRDRDERYSSADEMGNDLQAFLRLREDSHDVATLNRHLQRRFAAADSDFEAGPDATTRPGETQQPPTWRRFTNWLVAAAVLLAGVTTVIKMSE